ncbi:MAG: hypothetical protein KGD64_09175 [Candidatus Heimdallarchaeota archaeon]|nr:hypothetical protein [Candidatus Heimdallarchaeota archaeon]
MKIKLIQLKTVVMILVVVMVTIPNSTKFGNATNTIVEINNSQNKYEIFVNINQNYKKSIISTGLSEIRELALKYITNRNYTLEERYNVANYYTRIISKGTEDLVLFLIAYELSKIFSISILPGINSHVIYLENKWSILITHGNTYMEESTNELVDLLASQFKLVVLASCFSSIYSQHYSNVIGFSNEISTTTILEYISLYFHLYLDDQEIKSNSLLNYELDVHPDEFVNVPGLMSELVMDFIFEIYCFNRLDKGIVNLKAPLIITLEQGTNTETPRFGCEHINAYWGSTSDEGDRMSNRHIEEVFFSTEAYFFWSAWNIIPSKSLIIAHLNPQPDNQGDEWWISYIVMGIRPQNAWTNDYPTPYADGWQPYFTITTAGFAYKKSNHAIEPSLANIFYLFWKKYRDVEVFPVATPTPHYEGYEVSLMAISSVSTQFLDAYGDYNKQKADQWFVNIFAQLSLLWNVLVENVLQPIIDWVVAHPTAAIVIAVLVVLLILGCIFAPQLAPVAAWLSNQAVKIFSVILGGIILSVQNGDDDDFDGISNDVETYYFDTQIRDTAQEQDWIGQETTWLDGKTDYDEDGLSTYVELDLDFKPFSVDSDNDGESDENESYWYNPYFKDSDDDEIPDFIEERYFDTRIRGTAQEQDWIGQETTWLAGDEDYDFDYVPNKYEILFKSDPYCADTDGDGKSDLEEIGWNQDGTITYISCPYLVDSDTDGISDKSEELLGTEPLNSDTDEDGLIDGWEIYTYQIGWNGVVIDDLAKLDPLDAPKDSNGDYSNWASEDSDFDGLNNSMEARCFTCSFSSDTDGDGLNDYDEVFEYGTDPTTSDTDKDGLDDEEEINYFLTDPTKFDTDGDWMPDNWEIDNFLNPFDINDSNFDPDNDDLMNFDEYTNSTDPQNDDTDNDQLDDGSEILTYYTNPLDPDTDGDLLLDGVEVSYGINPLSFDTDNDSLGDYYEIMIYYTNPNEPDTDGDNLNDGIEVYFEGTNPLDADTDNDGLEDGEELNTYNTDPLNSDTDGDGMPDGWEIEHGFNPLSHDSSGDADSDGATNLVEYLHDTNPHDSDTDNDGIPDGWEINYNFNPLVNDGSADPDNDGVTNLIEYTYNTNPFSTDTDGDTMPDAWEITYCLNPINANDKTADYDGDGLRNFEEFNEGTDPTEADTDGDDLDDLTEVIYGTNPLVDDDHLDYDGDGLTNYEEINGVYDFNGDGDYTDPGEVTGYHTQPTVFDTDGDGYGDGYEVDPDITYEPSDPTDPNSIPTVGGGGGGGGFF